MLRQRKIHLFNCDQLYELSIIENLLNSSKRKLAFDFTVECHYFSLSEIAELSEKVIPALQIDFAFFVVHAHESRLSINDGRGYTKVYRALLQKTGKNFKRDLHTHACMQYNVIVTDLSRIFVPAGYVQKGMKDQQKLSTNVFVVNINRLM